MDAKKSYLLIQFRLKLNFRCFEACVATNDFVDLKRLNQLKALTGLCSLVFPLVAKVSLTGAIVVRILTGIFAGPAIPVTRGSLGPWAPHDEYGRLVSLQD